MSRRCDEGLRGTKEHRGIVSPRRHQGGMEELTQFTAAGQLSTVLISAVHCISQYNAAYLFLLSRRGAAGNKIAKFFFCLRIDEVQSYLELRIPS